MARAKRTSSERAAARRRYRAAIESEALEADDPTAPTGSGAPPTKPVAETVRIGIVGALRASVHPLNVREDLAVLPSLITHKAVWIPVLVTIGSTVAVAVVGATNGVAAILFSYFVQAPGIGGSFLAGFLAPRASWLLGGVVGMVSAVCYAVIILAFPLRVATTAPDAATAQDIVVGAVISAPVMGALFASAAAWYKRFLTLSNPNRGRRNQQAKKSAGDGRSRASNGQKANAKAPVRR